MPSLKVDLSHVFAQVKRSMPQHGATLQEFEKHLRETVRGEHTLQELAEVYCLEKPEPSEVTVRRERDAWPDRQAPALDQGGISDRLSNFDDYGNRKRERQ